MNEITVYAPIEAALADLATRYKGIVYDVTDPDGMAQAKAGYKDINQYSIALEKARKAEKEESLNYGRRVDAEAKRIAETLDGLRLPIKDLIETETKRAEREREEKVRIEMERLAAEEAAKKAAEEAKLRAERDELERRRAELEAAERQSRLDREEAERVSRAKIEAEERAARLVREDADRKAREAMEEIERQARAKAEAERSAAEAKARERRELEEAEERARRRRIEQEWMEDHAFVRAIVERFDKRIEFSGIVKAAKVWLENAAHNDDRK